MVVITIVLDRPFHLYEENEVISGKIVVKCQALTRYNKLKLKFNGGIYINENGEIYPYNPLIKIVGQEIEIKKDKRVLQCGENFFAFEFELIPIKGLELLDHFTGTLFNVIYFITAEIQLSFFDTCIENRMIKVRSKAPKEKLLKCETLIFAEKNSMKNFHTGLRDDKIIEGVLDNIYIYPFTGISGHINIKKSKSKTTNAYIKFYRTEHLTHDGSNNSIHVQVKKLQILNGDIEQGINLYFHVNMCIEEFSPSAQNSTFVISYEMKIVVEFEDKQKFVSNILPVYLNY